MEPDVTTPDTKPEPKAVVRKVILAFQLEHVDGDGHTLSEGMAQTGGQTIQVPLLFKEGWIGQTEIVELVRRIEAQLNAPQG